MISSERLSDLFVDVADTLVADFDVVDFLTTLCEHATLVSGADAVGIMLADHRGELRFMAASNEQGKSLELLQLQTREGPCLDCVGAKEPVVNADLGQAADLWPRFAPAAIECGVPVRPRVPDATPGPGDRRPQPVLHPTDGAGPWRGSHRPVTGRRRHDRHPAGTQRRPGRGPHRAAPGRAQQQDRDRAGEGCPRAHRGHHRRRRPSSACATARGRLVSVSWTWRRRCWRPNERSHVSRARSRQLPCRRVPRWIGDRGGSPQGLDAISTPAPLPSR